MQSAKRILIVDDEEEILELLEYNLKTAGYDIQMAHNGKEAVEATKQFNPDVILMDIMMPVMDGIEACRIIRQELKMSQVFIIFLTARSEEYSEVAAFEAGANDYIIKPIKPRALTTRLDTFFLRQKDSVKKPINKVFYKDLIIDKEAYIVYQGDKKISLPKKEFELLYYFCQNPNKILTREDLLKRIWTDVTVVSRTVDVHIRKIREKIGEGYINTIKGIGYKLEE